jgi:hypothetical protein
LLLVRVPCWRVQLATGILTKNSRFRLYGSWYEVMVRKLDQLVSGRITPTN